MTKNVRTTMANLDEHMLRLPMDLPQTFADAIAVTKSLGIRYLWIDSLVSFKAQIVTGRRRRHVWLRSVLRVPICK